MSNSSEPPCPGESNHKMWSYAVEGLYPAEIKEAVGQYVASIKNPVILDIGCGTAIWPFPSNFSYKNHDLTSGLPPEFKTSGLDIVHCRMVLQHLPDSQAMVDSLVKCLNSGGFLFIAEGSMEGAFDEHKDLVKPFIYGPSLSIEENLNNQKKLSWHSGCLRALGLSIHPPTYQPPRMLVQRSKILKEVTAKDCWVPIYWEGENLEHGKELKQVGIENIKRLYGTASNSFSKSNIPAEITNALVERGLQEASEGKTYLYGCYAVARKPVA